ncbi:MAG TPA: hypothetical protein ENK44_09090 [Caldithrix abyssi]|uniref:Glycosyltransferase RgtA/B/C/D-like domain-containing protein n=1 Tax=Caldithrix abyssi TaxID=187145 RepID=A0A7V4U0U6_CALAY|nr:hypothetical protein [Caldithrix abyssi]
MKPKYKKIEPILLGCITLFISIYYLVETHSLPHRLIPVADAMLYYSKAVYLNSIHDLIGFPLSKFYVVYIFVISKVTSFFKYTLGLDCTVLEILTYLNAVLYSISVGLIVWLGNQISRMVGVLSGTFMILFGPAIFYQGVALPIVPILFLETVCLVLLHKWLFLGKNIYLILFLIILGILIELRPHFLIIIPVLSGFLFFSHNKTIFRRKTFSLFLPLLALWPVLLFLLIQGKSAEMPIRSSVGMNLFIGNHSGADGLYTKIPYLDNTPAGFQRSSKEYIRKQTGTEISSLDENVFWLKRVINFYYSKPKEGLLLFIKKFQHLLSGKEFPLNYDYAIQSSFSDLFRILKLNFGFLIPLALVFTFIKSSDEFLSLVKIWFWSYVTSLFIFFISSDHRMPLLPVAVLFSACLFHYLYKTMMLGSIKKIVAILSVILILTFISLKDDTSWPHHYTYHQIGEMSIALNNKKFALKAFTRALVEKPDFLPSLIMTARLNQYLGDQAKTTSYSSELKKLK